MELQSLSCSPRSSWLSWLGSPWQTLSWQTSPWNHHHASLTHLDFLFLKLSILFPRKDPGQMQERFLKKSSACFLKMCNNHLALIEFTSVRLEKSQLCKNDLAWTNAFIELRIWGPCAQQPVCNKTIDQMRKGIVLVVKMNIFIFTIFIFTIRTIHIWWWWWRIASLPLLALHHQAFCGLGSVLPSSLNLHIKKKTQKSGGAWLLDYWIFLQHAYLKFYLLPCYFSACSNFQLSSGDLGALYPGHI